ncbi:MAG: AAA family ATPase [Bdellovibrionales bacterium]|nr:AAA family ATPase [Bdellovibrionales bacterium]
MIPRLIKCSKTKSFFLFGGRATGKSSYLQKQWSQSFKKDELLWIDLLEPEKEREFNLRPSQLAEQIEALKKKPKFIVIDEIQKAPKLLDVAHQLIQKKNIKFALTGSSIRKLKYGSANLLAGRAFLYKLFPLTFLELKEKFELEQVLQFGSLPEIFNLNLKKDKIRYLNSYIHTYLKEEIVSEQIIRNIEPFRYFLEVAGQCNGLILNYSKIAREAGIDYKNCQRYFEILEDTLLGFHLPAFSMSIRKQQNKASKFYLFDLGVARALAGLIVVNIQPAAYSFGQCFEHLVIAEVYRLNEYLEANYKMSYFHSKDGLEIDLILQKDREKILIEIKSKKKALSDDLKNLKLVKKDIPKSKGFLLSLDKTARKESGIFILHWQEGLKKIFGVS